MNRGIIIAGLVLSTILSIYGFITTLTILIELTDLLLLAYTIPAAVVGTTIALYFTYELHMTFVEAKSVWEMEQDRAHRLNQLNKKLQRNTIEG